ncbi:nuclear transport factor 2 family protein [Sphingomonas sp. RB3P16]|uniref:nuclear transport factor 2 family protein n=1 Tax=Parasphingomonas frigoris TaxID=3096163 RepID=UPI002FC8A67E
MTKPTYIDDHEAITTVLTKYIDGCKQADSAIMKPAFAAEATMFGVVDGALTGGPIQTLFDGIDAGFTPAPEARSAFAYIDISGSAASARIDSNDMSGSLCFTDYFNLLKVDGEWTVISKVYHTHATPAA